MAIRPATAFRAMRRVPVVFQTTRAECGVAALAMVLGYYRFEISLREARERCAVGRNGVTAGAVARAARDLGLTATGRMATPEAFTRMRLPAIAHWNRDHFVVVERVGARRIDIVDPRLGRRRLTPDEFYACVGQVAIELAPGAGFKERRAHSEPFWRAYARSLLRLPGTSRVVAQVLLASALLQALGLAMPLVVRIAVDGSATLRGAEVLTLLGIGIGIVGLAQLVTAYLRATLVIYLQGRLDSQSMLGFCGHLLRLPLRYFQQRSTGDIVLRISSIQTLRELLTSQTLSSVLDAGTVLSYLVLLFVLDIGTGVGVLAAILLELSLLVWTTGRVRERMAADVAAHAESQGHITEILQGITTIKSAGAESQAIDRWAALFLTWMKATLRRSHISAAIDAVAGSLRVLTPLVVLWLGTLQVLGGRMTPGTMLALTWMAASVLAPVSALVSNGQRLQLAGAQLQRLADVLESEPEFPAPPEMSAEPVVRPVDGRVEFRDVSFQYDPYGQPALRHVTIHIEPGQRVAVVGATGAGKSTLGMLLLGLYQPSEGDIRVDGVNLGDVDPRLLRRGIGSVLQEPFVFAGTLLENITFRDPSVSRADAEEAARLAALHDEVLALPNGYDTRLAERGTGLSGGQRQRLAIARALARRPGILLLDEATSHLDAVTEARVHDNLRDVRCTQIIIAHRLSTIRDANLILMLDRGRLTELGTHDDLLSRNGAYAALIGAQIDGTRGPNDMAERR